MLGADYCYKPYCMWGFDPYIKGEREYGESIAGLVTGKYLEEEARKYDGREAIEKLKHES